MSFETILAEPMFEEEKTQNLRNTLGESVFYSLLAELPVETKRLGEAMADCISDYDAALMRRHAHALKGVCANYGATRLMMMGRAIHDNCEDPRYVTSAVGVLAEQLDEFGAYIDTLCKGYEAPAS